MKIILTSLVNGLGKKGDIKEVSEGYARNFLFPKGLARDISSGNEQLVIEKKEETAKKKTSALYEKIESLKLEFKEKAHDNGNLYGSIGQVEIMEKLSAHGVSLSKSQILLEKPYRKTGSYEVKIKLSSSLLPELKLKIIAEK